MKNANVEVECRNALLQTCRLLRHVSGTEPLEITCVHAEETFQVTGQQVCPAAYCSFCSEFCLSVITDRVQGGESGSA